MRTSLLVLALAFAAAAAHAETAAAGKLQVSARVVVTCRLDVSVPRTAAMQGGGTGSFAVTCTRGAAAAALSCTGPCMPPPQEDKARTEIQVAESRGEGPAVATLLF
jgi:hypothetical protein